MYMCETVNGDASSVPSSGGELLAWEGTVLVDIQDCSARTANWKGYGISVMSRETQAHVTSKSCLLPTSPTATQQFAYQIHASRSYIIIKIQQSTYMQPNPSKTRQARVRPTCTYKYPPSHPTAYPFTEPSKASYMHHYLSLRYTKEEYGTCRTRTGLEVVCCHRLRD